MATESIRRRTQADSRREVLPRLRRGPGLTCACLRHEPPLVAGTTTDAELVSRCRSGDQAAWNELVERFSRYVYAICTQGFRLSEHDAEDVFQDVFTRVSTPLDRL